MLYSQETQPGPSSSQSGLRFISGIISKSKVLRFERILFRATRGNMLFNQSTADDPIMDPLSTEMVRFLINLYSNHVFIAFLSPFVTCYRPSYIIFSVLYKNVN